MRPTRVQTFMEIAHVIAKRATCFRLNVGAVIVSNRSIVSVGYNGVPAGESHCTGNSCPGKHRCELTTHAEVNAINHLPRGVSGPLDIYVTDSPCQHCWEELQRVIPSEGGGYAYVQRVFFSTPYRITEHLEGVRSQRTPHVYRVLPAGYVMEWGTKELVEIAT